MEVWGELEAGRGAAIDHRTWERPERDSSALDVRVKLLDRNEGVLLYTMNTDRTIFSLQVVVLITIN